MNFSISYIKWRLFEAPTHFLAWDPENWTIALVASTFKPNDDFGHHEKFNGALHRAHTSELQLRLSPTKLIWASNSLAIGRSKLSPHDWEWWNQKISMVLIFCLQMLYNWFYTHQMTSFLSFWDWMEISFRIDLRLNQMKTWISCFLPNFHLHDGIIKIFFEWDKFQLKNKFKLRIKNMININTNVKYSILPKMMLIEITIL